MLVQDMRDKVGKIKLGMMKYLLMTAAITSYGTDQ
jgi:hypothetical protein